MTHSYSERKMIVRRLCSIFYLSFSIFVFASPGKYLCRPDQRHALWEFKREFYVQRLNFHWWKSDPKTEKWRKNTDCCFWDGVSCELKTGMVIELDLKESFLNGPLTTNSSLFRLQYRVLVLTRIIFLVPYQIPSATTNIWGFWVFLAAISSERSPLHWGIFLISPNLIFLKTVSPVNFLFWSAT